MTYETKYRVPIRDQIRLAATNDLWPDLAIPGGELGEVEVGPDRLEQGQAAPPLLGMHASCTWTAALEGHSNPSCSLSPQSYPLAIGGSLPWPTQVCSSICTALPPF